MFCSLDSTHLIPKSWGKRYGTFQSSSDFKCRSRCHDTSSIRHDLTGVWTVVTVTVVIVNKTWTHGDWARGSIVTLMRVMRMLMMLMMRRGLMMTGCRCRWSNGNINGATSDRCSRCCCCSWCCCWCCCCCRCCSPSTWFNDQRSWIVVID